MSNKKFSDLTAATTLAGGDLFAIETAGGNSRRITAANACISFRGALVTKASDETGANYSSFGVVPWTTESGGYDTDSFHDNSTNNSRLTVPSNVGYVRVGCCISIGTGTLTASDYVRVYIDHYNSSSVLQSRAGMPVAIITEVSASTSTGLGAWSAAKPVTAGDYFIVTLDTESDTSITLVAAESWFAIEVVG